MNNITVVNNPPANYVPYSPRNIKQHNNIAFKAAMEVLFAHTADVFSCIVDIIADKYELDANQIIETVINHPKYTSLSVHPVINSLSYFTVDDAVSAACEPAVSAATVSEPVKKILKIKRVAK
jgi:hypothetical protein